MHLAISKQLAIRCCCAAALSLSLSLTGANIAHAHDPGLSSVTIEQRASAGHFSVIIHDADLPEHRRARSASCSAEGVLLLSAAGRPLAAPAACRSHDTTHTAFEGTFDASVPGPLSLELTLLAELPRGHRSFLRVFDASGRIATQRMLSSEGAQAQLSLQQGPRELPSFFTLGLEHIAFGTDHLLFLFALLLGVDSIRRMALVVSTFTVAHSLTLALATLEWLRLPAELVEPIIAASIVLVALRNFAAGQRPRERLATTFGFGLVHGLGFASALSELGVRGGTHVVAPLLLFNLGVETGQLAFGALLLPLLVYVRRLPDRGLFAARALSGMSALAGVFWLLERTLL